MLIVRHRVNTRAQLEITPSNLGVEVDLRSRNDELILEPSSRFVLGYRYIDNSLIISSENKLTGYKNNYTNEIYLFLIQDELIKDIRYPT